MSLATYALTDYQSVLDKLGVSTYPQPGVLEGMINTASRQIIQHSKREVKPLDPSSTVRRFPLSVNQFAVFMPSEPHTVTLVRVDIDGTFTTIASTGYQLYPYDNGCYRSIQIINPYGVGLMQPFVEVTGTWGWPAVTDDMKDLCEYQVVQWVRRGSQIRSTAGSTDSGETNIAAYPGLSYAVRDYLDVHYSVTPLF